MTKHALILGGVSFDSVIYLEKFPGAQPGTVFARGFHETVGSTGAGKALNLHRLGFTVTLHDLVGEDEYGTKVQAYFRREGLAFIADHDPAGTKRHVNLMNAAGQRISIFVANGTFEPRIDLGSFAARFAAADYVVLNIINYCRTLIPLAKAHEKPIWCDLHDYDGHNPYHQDFVEAADYVFMSSDAMPDYRAFMERLIDAGKRLIVCTHGKDGATALTAQGQWIETPIVPVKVVDTNGAGDGFVAGFMYGYDRGYAVETCMRLATLTAGLAVSSPELAHPDLSPERLSQEYQQHYLQALA